jgi:methylsterol monooxygenase
MAFTNNYATSFRWWDRIFGTDKKYREYRARVRKAKDAMKSATEADKKALEQTLLDQVEAEGLKAEAEAEGSKAIKTE